MYASLDDLIERAGETEILQIADRDGDGIADPEVIDAALGHADNKINSWVGVKYRIPLTVVPDIVRSWAVSIARYYLHRYERPEYVADDYKDAMSDLKAVAEGKAAVPGAAGLTPAASDQAGTVLAVHPAPHFDLRGWR